MSETTDPRSHVVDLVAPYALGALEPAEVAMVERHVRGCMACARELDDVRRTVGMLAFAPPLDAPGPDVKAVLFARVAHAQRSPISASERRRIPAESLRPVLPADSLPNTNPWFGPAVATAQTRTAPDPARRSSVWARVGAPLATVPLVLALAVVAGWGMWLQNQVDDRTEQVQELRDQMSALDTFLAERNGTVQQFAMTAGIAGSDAAGGMIFADPDGPEAMLTACGLDDQSGSAYGVWVQRAGVLEEVGHFEVDDEGCAATRLQLRGALATYRSVSVTARPLAVGGPNSATPGTDVVLSGDIGPSVGSPSDETEALAGQ